MQAFIDKKYNLKCLVDKAIDEEEWNKLETIRYSRDHVVIRNYWTDKEYEIQMTDNMKTLRVKMEELSRMTEEEN